MIEDENGPRGDRQTAWKPDGDGAGPIDYWSLRPTWPCLSIGPRHQADRPVHAGIIEEAGRYHDALVTDGSRVCRPKSPDRPEAGPTPEAGPSPPIRRPTTLSLTALNLSWG